MNPICAPQIQDNMVGKGVLYILTVNLNTREHGNYDKYVYDL